MATEVLKSALSVLGTALEKLRRDTPLWFWMSVAAAVLLLLDRQGRLPLAELHPKLPLVMQVWLIVLVAVWLSCLPLHKLTSPFLTLPVAAIRSRWRRHLQRRIDPSMIRELPNLLRIPSCERRFLIYFIEAAQCKPFLVGFLHEPEFRGASGLVDLGILKRTGPGELAYVYLPRKVRDWISTLCANNEKTRNAFKAEGAYIAQHGRKALKDELPDYRIERYFEVSEQRATESW